MLVDYKDRVTGENFEILVKNRNEVPETAINEKTGNIGDKQFSAGSFKFAGALFDSIPYGS